MSSSPRELSDAYAVCLAAARSHYENFPVASWLLPAPARPHVAAVYAFARHADDLADEGDRSDDDRHRALDDWRAALRATVAGGSPDVTRDERRILIATAATIHDRGLSVELFEDLISAFRQDVTVKRYARWEDLLDYCRRSANPVGRLVLGITGHGEAWRLEASDCVCTALQLTNFLQDLTIDWARGRLYVPRELLESHDAAESGLAAAEPPATWRSTLADMADRTSDLFDRGRRVADGLPGRLGWELRLTWLGGRRVLDRVAANGYDPRASRPTLSWADALPIAWRAATWPRPIG